MLARYRIGNLLAVGIAAGVVAWGAVGVWTAATVGNYPWNQWIPFTNGLSKGVFLGLMAAFAAVIPIARGSRLWLVFAAAFAGGGYYGTYRDLHGPPSPILYFEDPMPDAEWFGTTQLVHWATKEAPPALLCAAAITLFAAFAHRSAHAVVAGVLLVAVGFVLLGVPDLCARLAPDVQGNGQHVNAGAWAIIRCWAIGLPVLAAGVKRLRSAFSRRSGADELADGEGRRTGLADEQSRT